MIIKVKILDGFSEVNFQHLFPIPVLLDLFFVLYAGDNLSLKAGVGGVWEGIFLMM